MSNLLPKGWNEFRQGDIANFSNGKAYKLTEWETVGTPVIRLQNLTGSGKNFYYSNLNLPERQYCKSGDLLYMWSATFGPRIWKGPRAIYHYHIWKITCDEKNLTKDYLYQLLEYKTAEWLNTSNGMGILHITKAGMEDLNLTLPPFPEQQKIAAILTSVDDVIEKTQAQINKLKDLKTGMMQELLTRGVGVDGKPHTEFKDSPVGRIPKAWDVLPLAKVSKLERGKFSHRPRNDPAFYNGDYPFLQTGDIPKSSPYITTYSQSLNDKGLKVSKLFKRGTLVITIAATIGEIGILDFDSCFPDSLVGISVDEEKADRMYILYVMRHLKSELDALAPQSAQKNINLDILNPFEIPVPSIEEQKKIAKSLTILDERIIILGKALQTKKDLKKALMQDLLTGKVRVKVD